MASSLPETSTNMNPVITAVSSQTNYVLSAFIFSRLLLLRASTTDADVQFGVGCKRTSDRQSRNEQRRPTSRLCTAETATGRRRNPVGLRISSYIRRLLGLKDRAMRLHGARQLYKTSDNTRRRISLRRMLTPTRRLNTPKYLISETHDNVTTVVMRSLRLPISIAG